MYRKYPRCKNNDADAANILNNNNNDNVCVAQILTNFGRTCPQFDCPAPKPIFCNGNAARSVNFNCNDLSKILTYSDTIYDMKKGESTSIAVPFSIPLSNTNGNGKYSTVVKYTRCPNDGNCINDCNFTPGPNAKFEVGSASVKILSIQPYETLKARDVKVNCSTLFSDQTLDEISPNFYELRLGTFNSNIYGNNCPELTGMCASISLEPYRLKYVFEYTVCGVVIDNGCFYRFYIKSINCEPLVTKNSVFNYIKGICIPKQVTIYPPYVNLSLGYSANLIDCVEINNKHPYVCDTDFGCDCGCETHNDCFTNATEDLDFNCGCGTTTEASFNAADIDNFMNGCAGPNPADTAGCCCPPGCCPPGCCHPGCCPQPVATDFVISGVTSVNPVIYAESVLPKKVLTLGNVINDPRFAEADSNAGHRCHRCNRWK